MRPRGLSPYAVSTAVATWCHSHPPVEPRDFDSRVPNTLYCSTGIFALSSQVTSDPNRVEKVLVLLNMQKLFNALCSLDVLSQRSSRLSRNYGTPSHPEIRQTGQISGLRTIFLKSLRFISHTLKLHGEKPFCAGFPHTSGRIEILIFLHSTAEPPHTKHSLATREDRPTGSRIKSLSDGRYSNGAVPIGQFESL
jgi:hypothetical protein